MQTIEVTFSKFLQPSAVKRLIEDNLRKNDGSDCTVTHVGEYKGENLFSISAEHSRTFYLAGMTAAVINRELIEQLNIKNILQRQ